jgi:hypothetical protein
MSLRPLLAAASDVQVADHAKSAIKTTRAMFMLSVFRVQNDGERQVDETFGAQPGRRSIEMMQIELRDPGDGVGGS